MKEVKKNGRVYMILDEPKRYIKSGSEDYNPNIYIEYLKKSGYKDVEQLIKRYKMELLA